MIGKRVEYQTGLAAYGIGIVTDINEETGIVVVKDDEDGSVWKGPAGLVEIWDEGLE